MRPLPLALLIALVDHVASPAASLAQLGRATVLQLDWGEVEDVVVVKQ